MGIKRKIILGFISIGTLLFISGVLSSGELIRFNRTAYNIMQTNKNSIELSKRMLDAVQEQNTALLMSITDTMSIYDTMLSGAREEFNRSFTQAQMQLHNSPELRNIQQANQYYNSVVNRRTDSVTMAWFSQIYKTSYYNLTHSIKELMVATQRDIIAHTETLENNAYRASMVGIIALAGGVLLMLLFYFMINNFFISPVLKIREGLKKSLSYHLPYDVKIDTKDEINSLNNDISQLISQSKR